MKMIPYARQAINDDDINSVIEILKSDWLTTGPAIEAFEQACATYCQARYAIALSNATAGLHLACLALHLGSGDILWTTPNTFVASSNCALYCGAKVDFVDIDPKTYNFSAEKFAEKLKIAKQNNALPKVIVVTHFAGQSCDMKAIKQLADQFNIKIIEDASHAIGGKYLDKPIGNCQYSDITIFSFHPVKIITTGEGGMVLTNSDQIKNKIQLLRTHGITRDPKAMVSPSQGAWYYQQIDLGYNYRITDFQAALGLSQLKRIDSFIQRRHQLAEQYHRLLQDLPLIMPWQGKENYSSYHLFPIQLELEKIPLTRKQVFDQLRQANIGVNVLYIPVHTQPYYQNLGFKPGDFPVAEAYYGRTISLPIYYSLSDQEQLYVTQTLKDILLNSSV